MKTLLMMRHAKSNQDDRKVKETQRVLTKKGERRASEMGLWIKEQELIPQLILSSNAVRACQTAHLVAQSSGYNGEIRATEDLYMAEADEIIGVLKGLPDDLECVMVVGHNPGLESMIPLLTMEICSLPPAGLAYLILPIEHWSDLNLKTKAGFVAVWRPKELETNTIPALILKS